MKIGSLTDTQVTIIGAVIIALITVGILVVCYLELKKIGPYEGLPETLQGFAKSDDKKTKAEALATKIKKTQSLIDQHNKDIARMDELQDKINDLQTAWSKLNKMIPPDINYSELQYKIGSGAEKTHITLTKTTRGNPVYFDANISKINLSLSGMQGSFHNFGEFLYFLFASLQRFMVLQNFSITSGAPVTRPADANINEIQHKISMSLVTFIERHEK